MSRLCRIVGVKTIGCGHVMPRHLDVVWSVERPLLARMLEGIEPTDRPIDLKELMDLLYRLRCKRTTW